MNLHTARSDLASHPRCRCRCLGTCTHRCASRVRLSGPDQVTQSAACRVSQARMEDLPLSPVRHHNSDQGRAESQAPQRRQDTPSLRPSPFLEGQGKTRPSVPTPQESIRQQSLSSLHRPGPCIPSIRSLHRRRHRSSHRFRGATTRMRLPREDRRSRTWYRGRNAPHMSSHHRTNHRTSSPRSHS